MKTLKKILDFILSKQFLYLIIITIIIYVLFVFQQNKNLKHKLEQQQYNIEALNDSIKTTKLKNGELQYSITSFISSEKNLRELNNELYEKIRQQNGKVIALSNTILSLKQDSLMLANALKENNDFITQINDSIFVSTWSNKFKYDDNNFEEIIGHTKINFNSDDLFKFNIQTNIIEKNTQIDLTFGYKMDNDKLHVFVQSAYPGFTTNSLKGVYIDDVQLPGFVKPKKHWFTGFGIGPSLGVGYSVGKQRFTPTIGVSLTYNIYQW